MRYDTKCKENLAYKVAEQLGKTKCRLFGTLFNGMNNIKSKKANMPDILWHGVNNISIY